MSSRTNDLNQDQAKGSEKAPLESDRGSNLDRQMPEIDRIGLFKLWTPDQKDNAFAHLPAFELLSGDMKDGRRITANASGGDKTAESENKTSEKGTPHANDKITAKNETPLKEKVAEKDKPASVNEQKNDAPAKTFELHNMEHRAARHNTPDAVVRLPQGFDPSKPINVVIYNHGFGSNAKSAYQQNRLDEQMKDAPPNTVLIVPEWQQDPGSRSGAQGRFSEPGMFNKILQETFDKTDGLKGKTLKDVDNVSIFAHSAGYGPTETEIYKNGLGDKVKSITLLDALYDGHGFDRWLGENIKDLSEGKKQFNNFFFGTSAASKEQAQRVKEMLGKNGLPKSSVLEDYREGGKIEDPAKLNEHGIVFKYSNATDGVSGGPHLSMPGLYVGVVERAAKNRALEHPVKEGDTLPSTKPKPVEVPAPQKPSTEKPSTEKPSTEKPSAEKPSAEKPSTEKPSTEKPSSEKPPTEKPSAEKPSTDLPVKKPDQANPPDKKTTSDAEARIDGLRKTLEDAHSSVKQKAAACEALFENLPKGADGRVHLDLNDSGKNKEFEIERTQVSPGVYLTQLAIHDSSHQEHPVLRFVDRHNKIENQRDSHGAKISYQGAWNSIHNPSSNVAKTTEQGAPGTDRGEPKHHKPSSDNHKKHTPKEPEKKEPDKKQPEQKLPEPKKPEPKQPEPKQPEQKQPEQKQPEPKQPEQKQAEQKQPEPKQAERKGNETERPVYHPDQDRVVRTTQDLKNFYKAQDDGVSCSAYSMAMLFSDQASGKPVSYGKEASDFKKLAGTTNHGYRGDLQSIANKLETLGLDSKAYRYDKVGAQTMNDLNKELDQGHTAVARVINPHTGNAHYIYVAGRDANGKYVIGDPDRHNKDHFRPVDPTHLLKMMSGRDGFVAGWAKADSGARFVADTVSNRRTKFASN